jgi:twitching motility protein PilT
MSLVPSLLQAIVQLDGEALVMHAGDKPYVVTPTGQVDLASRGLTLDAVNGIVSQLLPPEVLNALDEFGAAQYQLPARRDFPDEQFTVVAARGGDDIWMEIRRRCVPDDDRIPDEIFGAAAFVVEPELVAAGPARAGIGHESGPSAQGPIRGGGSAPISGQAPADDETLLLPDAAQLWGDAEPPAGPAAAMPMAHVAASAARGLQLPDEAELWGTDGAAQAPIAALPDAMRPLVPAPSPDDVWADAAQLWRGSDLASPEPAGAASVSSHTSPGDNVAIDAGQASASSGAPVTAVTHVPVAPAPVDVPIDHPTPRPATEYELPPPAVRVYAYEFEPPPLAAPLPVAELESPPPAPPVYVYEPAAAPAFVPTPAAASLPAAIWRDAAQLWRSTDMRKQPIDPSDTTATADSEAPVTALAPGLHADPSEAVQSETGMPPSGVVLPISRTALGSYRPPARVDGTVSGLDRLLRLAAARGASTLYVSSNTHPWMRVDGELQAFDGEPILAPADVELLLLTMMPERTHDALRSGAPTEWVCELEEVGRVRCVSFVDQRGPGGVFRLLASRAASTEQLALWREIQALVIEPEGLVLVAGPRSSGKRTLMAAFVDQINRTRRDHVISIESEINVIHERGKSFVSQRAVRGTTEDVLIAARAALREEPDVLVIEDLRTGALVNVALEAAASGHLVIGGFSAHSTTQAIDRIIDFYAPENRPRIQAALAEQLRAVVVQVHLRNNAGGRLWARELLLNTPAVANVIAEGKTSQLTTAIEAGRRHGMVTLNDSLAGLVQSGAVEASEAYRRSADRAGFLSLLKRRGIDGSFIERLA